MPAASLFRIQRHTIAKPPRAPKEKKSESELIYAMASRSFKRLDVVRYICARDPLRDVLTVLAECEERNKSTLQQITAARKEMTDAWMAKNRH